MPARGTAAASQDGWEPVSAERLDETRGGFTTPAGLEVSLGIQRLVTINGDIVAKTTLQIADIRAITPRPSCRKPWSATPRSTATPRVSNRAISSASSFGCGRCNA